METELSDRMRHYPNPSNATLQGRVFCVRSPPKRVAGSVHRWHTLDELYDLPSGGDV